MNKENYELFKSKVLDAVKAYYGDYYNISIRPVNKLNGITLYGLNILENGYNTCPTIYLEEFFDQYQSGESFSEVFKSIINMYETHKDEEVLKLEEFSDYERIRNNLTVKLINYHLNEDLLQDIPYRLYEDLALVCIVEVRVNDSIMGSILIHNNHICMWGVKSEIIINDAIDNACKINNIRIEKLADTILNLYEKEEDGEELELIEKSDEEVFMAIKADSYNMFVLSNKKQIFGAAVIAYPGLLSRIGDALDDDFYILPSSIHEVIILPTKLCGTVPSLNSMIRSVNSELLDTQEILSDHAYLYSVNDNRLFSILDTEKEKNEVG